MYDVANASGQWVTVSVGDGSVSHLPDIGAPIGCYAEFPTMINRAQAYFWSRTWQHGERESLREIGEGNFETFADGTSAVRWLLSDDDA